MRKTRSILIGLVAAFGLSACANDGLRDLRSDSEGPDEFLVLPVKPLQKPTQFSQLPKPTPGGSNRVEPRPLEDGVRALGGRVPTGTTIPASDAALVSHTSRFGVTPNVRETLAQADADFRRRRSRLTQYRIVPVDRYDQVYRRQALDPFAEARKFRRAGIRTPSSPPPGRRR